MPTRSRSLCNNIANGCNYTNALRVVVGSVERSTPTARHHHPMDKVYV
jgi:hypothetical protein